MGSSKMEDLTDVRCVHLAHMKDTLPFAHCRFMRSTTSLVDGHIVYLKSRIVQFTDCISYSAPPHLLLSKQIDTYSSQL